MIFLFLIVGGKTVKRLLGRKNRRCTAKQSAHEGEEKRKSLYTPASSVTSSATAEKSATRSAQQVGLKLALIGSIREEVLNTEELALELLKFLAQNYGGLLRERYGTEEEREPVEQLCELAKKRGCLKKGGEPDMGKAAAVLLEEFRSGRLGRITLELP